MQVLRLPRWLLLIFLLPIPEERPSHNARLRQSARSCGATVATVGHDQVNCGGYPSPRLSTNTQVRCVGCAYLSSTAIIVGSA